MSTRVPFAPLTPAWGDAGRHGRCGWSVRIPVVGRVPEMESQRVHRIAGKPTPCARPHAGWRSGGTWHQRHTARMDRLRGSLPCGPVAFFGIETKDRAGSGAAASYRPFALRPRRSSDPFLRRAPPQTCTGARPHRPCDPPHCRGISNRRYVRVRRRRGSCARLPIITFRSPVQWPLARNRSGRVFSPPTKVDFARAGSPPSSTLSIRSSSVSNKIRISSRARCGPRH